MSAQRLSRASPWKTFLARTLAGAVLLYTGISGLSRFPGEFGAGQGPLQRVTEIGVLGYGAAGTAAALALLFRHRWAVPASLVWAVAATLTGALSPIAFGGTSLRVGLASGLLTALVAGAVVWLASRATPRS